MCECVSDSDRAKRESVCVMCERKGWMEGVVQIIGDYLEVRDIEVEREVKEDRWMDWSSGMSVDNG